MVSERREPGRNFFLERLFQAISNKKKIYRKETTAESIVSRVGRKHLAQSPSFSTLAHPTTSIRYSTRLEVCTFPPLPSNWYFEIGQAKKQPGFCEYLVRDFGLIPRFLFCIFEPRFLPRNLEIGWFLSLSRSVARRNSNMTTVAATIQQGSARGNVTPRLALMCALLADACKVVNLDNKDDYLVP